MIALQLLRAVAVAVHRFADRAGAGGGVCSRRAPPLRLLPALHLGPLGPLPARWSTRAARGTSPSCPRPRPAARPAREPLLMASFVVVLFSVVVWAAASAAAGCPKFSGPCHWRSSLPVRPDRVARPAQIRPTGYPLHGVVGQGAWAAAHASGIQPGAARGTNSTQPRLPPRQSCRMPPGGIERTGAAPGIGSAPPATWPYGGGDFAREKSVPSAPAAAAHRPAITIRPLDSAGWSAARAGTTLPIVGREARVTVAIGGPRHRGVDMGRKAH